MWLVRGIVVYQVDEFVQLTIPQWLADKEGFDTCHLEGTVKMTTEKALLLETVDGGEVWLPFRLVEVE